MSNLDEILGGILKGVTNARVAADLASRAAQEQYSSDSVLGDVPVPRMVIRDAEVTLRFVVDEEQTEDFSSRVKDAQARLWWHAVSKALPTLVRIDRNDLKESEAFRRAVLSAARNLLDESLQVDVAKALRAPDEQEHAIAATATLVESVLAKLPSDLRQQALPSRELKKVLRPRLAALFSNSEVQLHEAGTATAALGHKLAVSVTKDALEAAAPVAVHELKLRLSSDDLAVYSTSGEGD